MKCKVITDVYLDSLNHRLCHSKILLFHFFFFFLLIFSTPPPSLTIMIRSTPTYFQKNMLIRLKKTQKTTKNNQQKMLSYPAFSIIFLCRKGTPSPYCLKLLSTDFNNRQRRNNSSLKATFDLCDLITRA